MEFIKFKSKSEAVIRIAKISQKEFWFCAKDILDTKGIKWGQKALDRFTDKETKLLNCEGRSARFVSREGLIALVAPKMEYSNVRKLIVELLDATHEHE